MANRSRKLWAAFAGAIVVLSACTSAAPTAPSSAPTGSPGTARTNCPNIDLRSPSGERIDLTGTWGTEREGTRAGIYFVRQVGECVWFAGSLPWPGDLVAEGPLGYSTVVFRGRAHSDFFITGEWVDVRFEGVGSLGSGGTITLRIEFREQPSEMRLVYVGGNGQAFLEPGYREEQSWIKISDGGAYPQPSPGP